MDIKSIVRENIAKLKPYSSARSEFKGAASVWLDANENPYNMPNNRYPDPLQIKVKEGIKAVRGVEVDQIFLGVGSDECIDLAYRIFCEPKVDNVVAISPTYGMYEVCADINDVEYRKVALDADFEFDADELLAAADEHTKIIWICSPNNPTGNSYSLDKIKYVCDNFRGIVVVDEAYIDFSSQGSMVQMLEQTPNMIVMQTFSKAWGSAAVRLGIAFASAEIISYYNNVKYPYNINILTQNYAIELLQQHEQVKAWVAQLMENRTWLAAELGKIAYVQHIYPTDANFVLIRVADANALYAYLCAEGIIIRNRNSVELCHGCVRITVGTETENKEWIDKMLAYKC